MQLLYVLSICIVTYSRTFSALILMMQYQWHRHLLDSLHEN